MGLDMLLFLVCLFSIYMWKPGIVVFRKLQSNAFVKLQTIKKIHYYKRRECLESYESIALKLAEDDYTWYIYNHLVTDTHYITFIYVCVR